MSPLRTCLLAITVVMGLGACSSPIKQTSRQPRTMMERMMKPDMNKKNPWEKDFNTASAGDRGGTGFFQKKGFHTNEFSGQKEFGGLKDYKTKGFAQADKASRYGAQDSRLGKQENRMGSSSYATKDSRYSTMSASQNSKAFRGSDKTFKSGEFQPAKKSLSDNKRILMEPGQVEEERNANAYSESDVKRMLGR